MSGPKKTKYVMRLKIARLYKKLLMNHVRLNGGRKAGKGGEVRERASKESTGAIRKQSWHTINRPEPV